MAVALVKLMLTTPMGRRRAMAMSRKLYSVLDDAGIQYEPRDTAFRFFMLKKLFPWAYCRFIKCSRKELDYWVHIEGIEHLAASARAKQGVLLVSCHFGPGHLAKYVLAARGYSIHNMRANNGFVRKYGLRNGEGRMSREIYVKHDSSHGTIQTTMTVRNLLREGGIVACALDGKYGSSDGLLLTMLGRQRRFRTAMPMIAGLTGARIMPVFSVLRADGHIGIRVGAPFPEKEPDQSPLCYAEDIIRSYVAEVQAYCEANPGHVKLKPLD